MLEALAAELGARFAGWRGGPLEIRESFPLWYLPREALESPSERLDRCCIDAGHWHHQIHANGRARFVAHSEGEALPKVRLRSLSRGAQAGRVARTIAWVDAYIADPGTVRVLGIPWLSATALWLADRLKDRLVAIDMPTEIAGLDRRKVHDSDLFLTALGRAC